MTCIVGLIDEGKVYMGGDAAGTDARRFNQDIRVHPKVFKRDKFLIGYTTSFRMGQLLEFKFRPPRYHPDDDVYKYMVLEFAEALRECFTKGGFAKKEKEQELGGTFLVGFNGRLFMLYDDYQIAETKINYMACGCGDNFALGSLYTSDGVVKDPKKRIEKALEAATEFSAGVKGPFTILKEG